MKALILNVFIYGEHDNSIPIVQPTSAWLDIKAHLLALLDIYVKLKMYMGHAVWTWLLIPLITLFTCTLDML